MPLACCLAQIVEEALAALHEPVYLRVVRGFVGVKFYAISGWSYESAVGNGTASLHDLST